MKRSQSVVLTSLMAGAGLSLTACEGPVDTPVDARSYASVAECRTAGAIPANQCETAFAQAQKANEQNAPRFDDRQSCEEQFGAAQCAPRNNGSFFTPLLTGFIVGQMLNGGGGYRGAPMYRDRDGNYIGGAGNRISRDYVTGRTQVGSSAFDSTARAPTRMQSRSSVISRGGFGGGFGGRTLGG
jgi:uncharacterized protein YgiB involved in biofilm formation